MKNPKKDSYWGTSVRKLLTDGESKYNEEGTIYINLRDTEDKMKIVKIVKHELGHLIDNKDDLKKVIDKLDEINE